MGLIQNSLNQLTLSAIGAVGAIGYGLKGYKPEQEADTNEYTFQQPQQRNSYTMAAKAQRRGNDYIAQKARAVYSSPAERLARIKAATSMEVSSPAELEVAKTNAAMSSFTKKGDKE